MAAEVIEVAAEGRWPATPEPVRADRGRRLRLWGPVIAGLASAAVIALMVLSPERPKPLAPSDPFTPSPSVAQSSKPTAPIDSLVYTSTELPHRGERRIDRDYVGVLDDSQELLLLFEVDRTRTVRIPVTGEL